MIVNFIFFIILVISIIVIKRNKRKKIKYSDKLKNIVAQFNKFDKNKPVVKNEGHVFGLPVIKNSNKLNLKSLNNILEINYKEKYAVIEGSVYVKDLLDILIKKNWIIEIPPDMVHLTFSGLIAGIGGGSTSYKHGFLHETLLSMDVLTGNGDIVSCSREENTDLFYSVPNSLGTLGYITKMKLKIKEGKPFVKVVYERFKDPVKYFDKLDEYCGDKSIDFLDGTIFSENNLVLVIGYFASFVPQEHKLFNKTNIYWKELKREDNNTQYFSLYDYCWRWDPDMYYTTMETPEWTRNGNLRRFVPKSLLQSTKYRYVAKLIGFEHGAPDCNDVFIPMKRSAEFFDWFKQEYKLYPIYICPVRCKENFTLWGECYYCDFGLGYGVNLDKRPENIDERLEEQIIKYSGRKLLYAPISCSEDLFWKLLDVDSVKYYELKDKYDKDKRFLSLYEKIKRRDEKNKTKKD